MFFDIWMYFTETWICTYSIEFNITLFYVYLNFLIFYAILPWFKRELAVSVILTSCVNPKKKRFLISSNN